MDRNLPTDPNGVRSFIVNLFVTQRLQTWAKGAIHHLHPLPEISCIPTRLPLTATRPPSSYSLLI